MVLSNWKKCVALSCAFFVSYFISAQCINGKISFSDTGEAASGVLVKAAEQDAFSDDFGYFRICPEALPSYIYFSFMGQVDSARIDTSKTIQNFSMERPLISLGVAGVSVVKLNRPGAKTAGSMGVLSTKALQLQPQISLADALNTIPGVRMESRGAGGSRRISIRDNFLRSPFAVRNVQIIEDHIPLTSPDGQSALELLEPLWLGSLTVLKNAPGAQYGSGHAGALLATNWQPSQELAVRQQTEGGPDWWKSSIQSGFNHKKWSGQVSFLQQRNEGFRDQERNEKQLAKVMIGYTANDRLSFQLRYSDYAGYWQLPGAITAEDALEDPTQANPVSEALNAHVARDRQILSLTSEAYIGSSLSQSTSIYLHNSQKGNPFGTSPFFQGIKDDQSEEYGLRSNWIWERLLKEKWNVAALAGVQYQNQLLQLKNGRVDGSEIYDIGLQATQGMAYTGIQLDHLGEKSRWQVNAQISTSATQYAFDDLYLENTLISLAFSDTYSSGVVPRISLAYFPVEGLNLYALYGGSFSNPSIFEYVDDATGAINELQPEMGQQWSTGAKWDVKNKIFVQVEYFRQEITDAIINTFDSNDAIRYLNEGNTQQEGIEAQLMADLIQRKKGLLRKIFVNASATWRSASFLNYNLEGTQLEGNTIPGVPDWSASAQWVNDFAGHIRLTATWTWTDKVALNNSNSDFSAAYSLLNVQLSKDWKFSEKWLLSTFAGLNNVSNTRYTSFFQLNGFGGKFFNPMQGRNAYGGIRLAYAIG